MSKDESELIGTLKADFYNGKTRVKVKGHVTHIQVIELCHQLLGTVTKQVNKDMEQIVINALGSLPA